MPVEFRPYERRTLEDLVSAIGAGMPGDTAYSIFNGVQQGALDRQAFQRDKHLAMRQARMDALSGLGTNLTEAALGGVPPQGLASLLGLQTATNPLLDKPNVQNKLEDILSNASTLSASIPPDPATMPEPVTLDAEDLGAIEQQVASAVATGATFADTRQAIVSRLHVLGVADEQIAKIENYLRQRWTDAGGTFGPQEQTSFDAGPLIGGTAGALGGAGIGAGLGSIIPGAGTAIGAGLGALVGAGVGSGAMTGLSPAIRQALADRLSPEQLARLGLS